jgi:hypothetical protein
VIEVLLNQVGSQALKNQGGSVVAELRRQRSIVRRPITEPARGDNRGSPR